LEQNLTSNSGVFIRGSWNDGQNETWAYTEIDASLSAGYFMNGGLWHRANDKFGIACVVNGLSDAHRDYLAAGGYGFIIGDGKLNYSNEIIVEAMYNYKFNNYFFISPDYQFVLNPAYNKDRGPVHIIGFRGHIEF
jgi:high affinity Mn2+ porin